jgi:hypothetical protein
VILIAVFFFVRTTLLTRAAAPAKH